MNKIIGNTGQNVEEEEEDGGENFDGEENAADQGSLRGTLSAAGDTAAGSSGVLAANSSTSQHSTLTDASSGIFPLAFFN